MNNFSKAKRKVQNYLFDHPVQNAFIDNFYRFLVTLFSALIFTIGFKCFIQPNYQAFSPGFVHETGMIHQLASSGASGLSQSFVAILKLAGVDFIIDPNNQYIMNFVFYFVINIPLLILGFFKVGKKFAIYSLINVGLVTILGILIPNGEGDFLTKISEIVYAQPVARILFAGICSGLACASAYKIESTAGGTDILAFYLSERKSAQIGIFSTTLNFVVVTLFTVLSMVSGGLVGENAAFEPVKPELAITIFLYTVLYMIVATLVVDTLNVSNIKVELQIFTKNKDLSQVILSNIPHGCTITEGKGGFTGETVYVIYASVRKNESKQVADICKKVDPKCFINVLKAHQVYGSFYRKPIK